MKRCGWVIGLREENIEEYNRLHANVWPEVLARIQECNIRNYSIFLRRLPDGKHYLFSYFEYVGSDFVGDMSAMAVDPKFQEWWKITDPMQEPLQDRAEGEWWATAEEVFHLD